MIFKKKPAYNAHTYLLKMFTTLVMMGVEVDSLPEKVGKKFVKTEIYPRQIVINNHKVRKALEELMRQYGIDSTYGKALVRNNF